ncbi:DsbA family protein [Seohaeicola saemankumensis]|jgi:protein-disulfide isomerase|uniref:DsbA family protein n=1 Tax=Seohaeicola TaxID=481178 RepID=UPI0007F4B99B|nr:DsbA family protein [Paracoccaceae bacterium]OAN69613.1 thiol-disulfide oxidoreductase [Rhodobacteraceae bacterium EhC02]
MNRRTALIGISALAMAAGGWSLTRTTTGGMPDLGVANAQSADIDTSGVVEMVMGAEDAPITLVEYASFTCPHCASFHNGPLKQLKAEYVDTGKVRFIYRDVYFDRFGLWAAMVARCDASKFFGIADLLYGQQSEWIAGGGDPALIAENLRRIGRVAGLENDQLEACLADNANAQALVAWYQANAQADDVNSTPTLIIDGEKHSNMAYADLKAILDEKLGE